VRARDLDDGLNLLERPDAPAAHVRRLLDADETRARGVPVAGGVRADRRVERVGREHARLAVDDRHHSARQRRRRAALEPKRMGLAPEQDLVAARADVQPDRDLVAHRPRRQEDRGLVAEERRHALLERADRRVVSALFVADLRGGDRRAHLGGRAGLGV
jgi:hypothetical protein